MDSATDLVRVPVKADSGKLFYVEGKGNIGVVDVEKARVYWREGDIAVFRTSFIRNRNLRATPQACCGLLCIFDAQYAHLEGETQTVRNVRSQHESGCRSRYRLGVIGFLQPTTTTKVVIYEWVGGVKPDGLTPLFLYEMIASRSKHFFQVSHHFREVRMELKIERKEHVLHFVNMCSCPPELHKEFPSVPLCRNSRDLCYEMLASGPDRLFHPAVMPKMSGFGKSTLVQSSWDVLLKKRKRMNASKWKGVPHWLQPPGKTVDNLCCDLYACCSDVPIAASEQSNRELQDLLAVPYARVDGDVGTICDFAYLEPGTWRMMLKQKIVSCRDHNKLLDTYNKRETRIKYNVLKLHQRRRGGIRVSLCSKKAKELQVGNWEDVKSTKSDINLCVSHNFVGPNTKAPGPITIRYIRQQGVRQLVHLCKSHFIFEANPDFFQYNLCREVESRCSSFSFSSCRLVGDLVIVFAVSVWA
jgi:hypothetical protein